MIYIVILINEIKLSEFWKVFASVRVWSCLDVVTALADVSKPHRPLTSATLSGRVNSSTGPQDPNALMPFVNTELLL